MRTTTMPGAGRRIGEQVASAVRTEPATRRPTAALAQVLAGRPVISIAPSGKSAFAVPLLAMCWQSRHQQTLALTGSAIESKAHLPAKASAGSFGHDDGPSVGGDWGKCGMAGSMPTHGCALHVQMSSPSAGTATAGPASETGWT